MPLITRCEVINIDQHVDAEAKSHLRRVSDRNGAPIERLKDRSVVRGLTTQLAPSTRDGPSSGARLAMGRFS